MKAHINKWLAVIKKYQLVIKLIFMASIILFVINQFAQILHGMTWSELKEIMFSQSKSTLFIFALLGFFAAVPLMLYDWATVKILEDKGREPMEKKEFFSAAWIINTLNNFAGFGGVIGATLRGKFYGSDLKGKTIVAAVSKVALFMLSGLSILSLVTLGDLLFFRPEHIFQNYWVWLLLGSLYTPVLVGVIIIRRKNLFSGFTVTRVIQLLSASLGQWLFAMVFFMFIGFTLNVKISPLDLYPLFVSATLIGMITMVPGGMGTFDVLMIMGLASLGVTKEMALVWLLFYRIFYFVIPFLSGLATYLIRTGVKINVFFDGLPKLISEKLAHVFLVILVYLAGILMVILSTIPNLSHLSNFFASISSYSFDFLDQTLNMMMGFLLLGLARGVANQVKKAYWPTVFVLVFCIVNTLSNVRSWKLTAFYLFILGCLYLSRKEFYRKQLVFSWEAIGFDALLYGVLFALYSVVGYLSSSEQPVAFEKLNFILFPSSNVWLKGLLGLLIAFITIFLLDRYLAEKEKPGEGYDYARINWLLSRHEGTSYSHLNYLKDRRYFFYQQSGYDKVFFQFQIKANKLFVLGDPVGEAEFFEESVTAFHQYADQHGYELIFYSVSDRFALLLHDIGFHFIKIGEEGIVDLQGRSSGELSDRTEIRLEVERLRSRGYTFTMYHSLPDEELLLPVKEVAAEWQEVHGRRYFSTGHFDEDYLAKAPIGIVRDQDHVVQGFVTLKPIKEGERLSYDLLQYRAEAPVTIGAFMLVSLLDYYREKGLPYFSIGLTPFAKVGEYQGSFISEKIVNLLYQYSYPQYGWKDLRVFKEGFATEWEARYLSYRSRSGFWLIAIQLHLLLTGSKVFSSRPFELLQLVYGEEKES
ncbi:bifunctional lysylphosphatidylglycerol flippase/synthetase MprF [Vagococcus elongatus]|uniref:Phosphatidylglycerol lysyltransferase n=1 Tax=Vagococcus elongatus TaxID=180344 RepID=A0A430AZQ6_9ENTE|nr:bifunctional lysylphosphatidylglycerol flippase/synthetase MprF [Vagococcus elongatus]RSU13548.1 hypothetical protein CBF29_04660 [Vagococcus elongatus]